VGVWLSGWRPRIRPAHRGGRTHLRRQRLGQSLFAGCRHRLHLLDVQSRYARAHRHQHRGSGRAVGGIFRRSACASLCRGCRHRRAIVEGARGGASGCHDHRRPGALRGPLVCAGLFLRGSHRRRAQIRVLQVSRGSQRAGCCDRQADLEELHHRGGSPARAQEQAGHPALGALGCGRMVVSHHRSEVPCM
jgi:hypothetical protein